MLLYHNTTMKHFKYILLDGKLKPSSKTKRRMENPYDFYSPYIFFNAIPKTQLDSFANISSIGICFDSSILLNNTFYTNNNHSAGNVQTSNKYKTSDRKELYKILYRLYRKSLKTVKSINQSLWVLSVFQEVFIRVEPHLINAKYILLPNNDKKLIKKIHNKYPHINIIIAK